MENETNKKSDIVSHQQAWGIILGFSDDDGDNKRFEIMNRYIAQQESRDNHLEEAAELLRRRLEIADRSNLLPEFVRWLDRDQSLSDPTPESWKDSACYCNQYQSSDIPCPPGKCPNAPPAPVAEAPERVTHAFAHLALGRLNHGEQWDGDFELMRRYIDQQEQSEREVAADTAPPKPGWNRGEFINPQNASEAHVRAIEALESGKVTQAVAWLCDAVRLLAHEPKT